MDYKNEMRKLIDIVKQQSFEATLADTMDDLLTLTTATKDLSDRINTRVAKSLNANDNDAIKYKPNAKSKAKKVKTFLLLPLLQHLSLRTCQHPMLCLLHQHQQTIFKMYAMTLWQSNKQVSQSSHKEVLERYRTNALLMLTTRKTHKNVRFYSIR